MNAPATTKQTAEAPGREAYVEYERRKARWGLRHPQATPLEHQEAMKRIAKELGI